MQDGQTLLLLASRAGQSVVVEKLLERKANINHKDKVCMVFFLGI